MFRPYIDSSYYERPGYIVTTIPYLWFAVPKLDEDNDGKVSAQELYDSIVGILRSIFEGFDVNRNGVLEKSEAIPENLFPAPVCSKHHHGDLSTCRQKRG